MWTEAKLYPVSSLSREETGVAHQHILTGRIVTVTRATVAPFIMMMMSSLET